MAFNLQGFQFNRGELTANAQGQGYTVATHSYKSDIDALATIAAPDYFPPYIDGDAEKVFVDDLLFIVGTDGTSLVNFAALNPVVLGPDLLISGATLSVGAPIVATDANGAVISGNVLEMELADASSPGIVSTGTQQFAGLKVFNNGIGALGAGVTTDLIAGTSGGTPIEVLGGSKLHVEIPLLSDNGIAFITDTAATTLAKFRTVTLTPTWTGPFTANPSGTIVLERFNNMVYMYILGIPLQFQNAGAEITSTTIIPSGYQPTATITGLCKVVDNITNQVGSFTIATNGTITISATVAGNAFAGAGSVSVGDIPGTWITTQA